MLIKDIIIIINCFGNPYRNLEDLLYTPVSLAIQFQDSYEPRYLLQIRASYHARYNEIDAKHMVSDSADDRTFTWNAIGRLTRPLTEFAWVGIGYAMQKLVSSVLCVVLEDFTNLFAGLLVLHIVSNGNPIFLYPMRQQLSNLTSHFTEGLRTYHGSWFMASLDSSLTSTP